MLAPFVKFYSFSEALAEKQHDLGSDQLELALSSVAPSLSNTQLSDITQISYANLSSRVITRVSSGQTSGAYKLLLQDLALSASGAVAGFRYVILFNQTSVNDLLLGYYDYGSVIALASGETFTVNFDDATGAIAIPY